MRWHLLLVLLTMGCRTPCDCTEPKPSPSGSASATVIDAPPAPSLEASIRLEREHTIIITFHNRGTEPWTLLRPLSGGVLKAVPGLAGEQTLPPPAYKLEATDGQRVYRGSYAPMWPRAEAESEANGGRAASPIVPAELIVPAGGTATQAIDLPFELPPARYELRFVYEYFVSSVATPARWFTGSIAAPAIELHVPPR